MYKLYPCEGSIVTFGYGSKVAVYDIFNPLPDFMYRADVIFTDSPWNQGNLRSFYTKAGIYPPENAYDGHSHWEAFYRRLFECIAEIRPKVCYLEIGKEHLADFIIEMRKLYKYTTFYNSGYYHKRENRCYVVRGANKARKPALDDMDEEDIIKWVCANEEYDCIGDLCMGRGLVGINAYLNGHRFVGTELNHKRLSVLIERIAKAGGSYIIEF